MTNLEAFEFEASEIGCTFDKCHSNLTDGDETVIRVEVGDIKITELTPTDKNVQLANNVDIQLIPGTGKTIEARFNADGALTLIRELS